MDDKIKIDLSVTDETAETKKNTQARDWCFTVNNPVQDEQQFMEYLQELKDLRYVVFQRERAPETGTEATFSLSTAMTTFTALQITSSAG